MTWRELRDMGPVSSMMRAQPEDAGDRVFLPAHVCRAVQGWAVSEAPSAEAQDVAG